MRSVALYRVLKESRATLELEELDFDCQESLLFAEEAHVRIEKLRNKDTDKAIDFAVTGMHFDAYLDSPLLQHLYGRYFWYLESRRATQVIAAYEGDELVGVLLADLEGERPQGLPWHKSLYVTFVDLVQKLFFKESAGLYVEANQAMLDALRSRCNLDGEITFLATNPDMKMKGIGTFLLEELQRRERGKRVYLFTDDFCTYQFYEHRGFERAGERQEELDMHGRKVPILCPLYTRVL